MFVYICIIIAAIPFLLMFRIKVIGRKNLKKMKKQNYIIACNHLSNYDPVLLDFLLFKKIHFLAKIQLFDTKLKAFFMRRFGAHPVDKDNFNPKSLKEMLTLINQKKIVGIFPQGKRCPTPYVAEDEIKEGVAMVAIRTGTPVIPMAYTKKIRPFRKMKLYIGEPMWPDETRAKDKAYQLEFSKELAKNINKLLLEEEKNENEGL